MEDKQYITKKILEEKERAYKNIYCPKAVIFNIMTLGMYGWCNNMNNIRRVGLW